MESVNLVDNSTKRPLRVMWLLNHGTARKFDLMMLRSVGIHEIFTPKSFPQEISFRSASVDLQTDSSLTIPKDDLDILNQADWYKEPGEAAWNVANKYFDAAFFIAHNIQMIRSAAINFDGALIWRAFGLDKTLSYTYLADLQPTARNEELLKNRGNRFWMGYAYNNLSESEGAFYKNRGVFLPLGMHDCSICDEWTGNNKAIYFVCPDIGFNPYYQNIYHEFKKMFSGYRYAIGGAQPITVYDSNVLGYVPLETHQRNMREYRLMFYHSTEPTHIHYHPFEAIRSGMPLVYMAGGMLDKIGGTSQPGRCQDIAEARSKIQRILNDDWPFIQKLKKEQLKLLDPMRPENCIDSWRDGFKKILSGLDQEKAVPEILTKKKNKRIAVIIPVGYRGGSLRGAKLLAQALLVGSRLSGEAADIILAHLDDPSIYTDDEFEDLHPEISRRTYRWQTLDRAAAQRSMIYAGHSNKLSGQSYAIPDDGMQHFMDCDLWVIVSDRLSLPLLPVRPYVCMVYDYLQRYQKILPSDGDRLFLHTARHAERVLVTTKFTEQDALQYAGIHPEKVSRVPMLSPVFEFKTENTRRRKKESYFIWTTNAALHKNHHHAMMALKEYYEVLDGKLKCFVTGVNTKSLLKSALHHIQPVADLVDSSQLLQKNIRWLGELSNASYQRELANAMFLWHPGLIDNGTFSVVEAAHLGVPALSSDYPAMREIDTQFQLNLTWMNADKPKKMANQLKWMEENALNMRTVLPSKEMLALQSVENLAHDYWMVLRGCL